MGTFFSKSKKQNIPTKSKRERRTELQYELAQLWQERDARFAEYVAALKEYEGKHSRRAMTEYDIMRLYVLHTRCREVNDDIMKLRNTLELYT